MLLSVEIDEQGVRPLPGAGALLDRVRGRLPLAVASNSPHALLEQALYRAGLARAFDIVLGADDVSRPKPAPDLYLRGVELLDVEAQATVASARGRPLRGGRRGREGGAARGAPPRRVARDPLVVERLGLDEARAGRLDVTDIYA